LQAIETRTVLPFFKDPKVKISIWTIIKDSIGKDLSKMSVPVYFNSPLSFLQTTCLGAEHLCIVDKAAVELNPIKRLAYLGCFIAVQNTNIEKFPSKPFNPLLGETFEFIMPGQFKFLAE
jgi:oxysterol-binding protein 1